MKWVVHVQIFKRLGHELHEAPGTLFRNCLRIKIRLCLYYCFDQGRINIVPSGNLFDEMIVACGTVSAQGAAILSEEPVAGTGGDISEMDGAIRINITVNIRSCRSVQEQHRQSQHRAENITTYAFIAHIYHSPVTQVTVEKLI
jgi:hypothetical protein